MAGSVGISPTPGPLGVPDSHFVLSGSATKRSNLDRRYLASNAAALTTQVMTWLLSRYSLGMWSRT
jgi:hypothetical protein